MIQDINIRVDFCSKKIVVAHGAVVREIANDILNLSSIRTLWESGFSIEVVESHVESRDYLEPINGAVPANGDISSRVGVTSTPDVFIPKTSLDALPSSVVSTPAADGDVEQMEAHQGSEGEYSDEWYGFDEGTDQRKDCEVEEEIDEGLGLNEVQGSEKHNNSEGNQVSEGDQGLEEKELRHLMARVPLSVIRILCVRVVEQWFPGKQATYPYSQGESSRPPKWPVGVCHVAPRQLHADHLRTLTFTAIDNLSAGQLRNAARDKVLDFLVHDIIKIRAHYHPGQGYEIALNPRAKGICELLGQYRRADLGALYIALVRSWLPNKECLYPYGGLRPPQWPDNVRHIHLNRLTAGEAITLASTIICDLTIEVLESTLDKIHLSGTLAQDLKRMKRMGS